MLLVIHNLPKSMRFYDVKRLILDKCGLNEVILDNFILDGDYKRVTVGLADEGDAALLVRKINGLYIEGCQLYVEDMRQKKLTEQPYRPIENPHVPQLRPEKKVQYNRQDDRMLTEQPYRPIENPHVPQLRPEKNVQYDRQDARMVSQPMVDAQPMISMPPVQMAYNNLPFYMSPAQTSYTNYDNHAAQGAMTPQPQAAYFQSPIQQPVVENQWTSLPEYASYPNKPQRLPNVDPNSNSRDWQWEEMRQSPSRSPARFSVPDDEPQWRDRKKTESSRREQGRRSPGRHRERSGNTYIRQESDGRFERDRRESSPARRRDEGNRSSWRDEDAMSSKHPSYIERSPPRDRGFDTRNREDRRQYDDRERVYDRIEKHRAVDYRDGERRRSSDRYEKSRDYDKLYEPRYNKPIAVQERDRDFGNKRPYTSVSQSSRTYGNDPDNCSFSVSNATIFEKQPIVRQGDRFRSKEGNTERGSFNHKVPAKRSRFDLNKVSSGPPKVDSSKPTSVSDPLMRKMIIRHNNWRYQVASIMAKQIMSAARGPGAFPNYANVFKKLKECVVARIDVRLGDTIVRSLAEMIESYRSRFPPEDDVTFFNAVLKKIECDEQETAADQTKENTSEGEHNKKVTTGASDSAENAAKDANLMPPPAAPAQIRIPSGNLRPSVPPFQNRAPNVTPTIQNSALAVTPSFQNTAPIIFPQFQNTAPTVTPQYQNTAPVITPQFQNTAPTVTPQYQNTAPIITPQFQNTAPTVTPHYQNTAPIITPQFQNTAPTVTPQYQNTAPIITPQFQNTAPTVTPHYQNTAPIITPQFQNTAPTVTPQYQNTELISTPLTNIAPKPNPYFQNTAPSAFQYVAPHPNPYYQNLPNPNPHFKNGVPTPRLKKRASNPQLIQLSPGNQNVTPPFKKRTPLPTPQMPTPSASKANNRTLVPIVKIPMTKKDVKKHKMICKLEFQNEDLFIVDPLLKQAIEDEIAPMVELYSKRPEYFMKSTDLRTYQTIAKETTDRFRRVLKLNLTKRVLDIKTGLSLRVFPVNRWPNNQLFSEWTKKNGIVNIKKCPEMYVVTCNSYKTYDDLAAMGTFKVGDVKMDIKTMHVAGPRMSVREKRYKNREVRTKQQVPGSRDLLLFDEDAEGAGIDNTNDIEVIDDEAEDTYNADAPEHNEVVVVEQEKDVVLIEDDDVTNTQGDVTNTQGDVTDAEGDEVTDLTEGDDADNDGNNVESSEKGNEETAEYVESLQNEQTNEEYMEKGEESLEMGEDTLEKTGDNLEVEITDDIADDDLEDF